MAIDTQSKKLLGNEWADSGERTDPEDVNIIRSVGWDVRYEQIGSGFEPERDVFNQLLRELSGWANDEIVNGVPPWDADVDYPQVGVCQHVNRYVHRAGTDRTGSR